MPGGWIGGMSNYRKHVAHEMRRNFQLDLFTPDDGHYEYSAVATNLALAPAASW
jgi:hypothetical protein